MSKNIARFEHRKILVSVDAHLSDGETSDLMQLYRDVAKLLVHPTCIKVEEQ